MYFTLQRNLHHFFHINYYWHKPYELDATTYYMPVAYYPHAPSSCSKNHWFVLKGFVCFANTDVSAYTVPEISNFFSI